LESHIPSGVPLANCLSFVAHCLLFSGFVSASGTPPVPKPPKTAPMAPPPSAGQEKPRHMLQPVPDGFLQFYGPNTPVAAKFRKGYFGMPYVLSPFTGEGEELHRLRQGGHLTFKKEGLGWRFISSTTLPPPPDVGQLGDDGGKEPATYVQAPPRPFAQWSMYERETPG